MDLLSALEGLAGVVDNMVKDLRINGAPVESKVAVDWPSEQSFHDVAACADRACLIAIADMNQTRRATNSISAPRRRIKYPTGIRATLSSPVLAPNGTATCTLALAIDSSEVNSLDGVGLVGHRGTVDAGAVAIGVKAESLGSLATKLRNEINSDATLSQWMSASVSGAVVTITNLTSELIKIEANVGNVQDVSQEVGRTTSRVMVSAFTADLSIRKLVGKKLEIEFNDMSRKFGYKIEDENDIRLNLIFPRISRDNSLGDLYRHDFVCDITYVTRKVTRAYEILVPISQTEVIENDF